MKEIAELHQKIDALDSALWAASAKLGKPVTCLGKHCCACCYEPVYCSDAEVKHLLEELTVDQKSRVTYNLIKVFAKASVSGLFDVEMPPVMEWLALKLPCPFLEFGTCMVYERRPISCRSHAACGPSDWCTNNRKHQIYPMAKEHSAESGRLILAYHAQLGEMIQDNLLALLSNELLGEPLETASGQKIIFKDQETTETKGQT